MTNGSKPSGDQRSHNAKAINVFNKNLQKIGMDRNYFQCGNIHLCVYVNTETGVVWGRTKNIVKVYLIA
jgi:hypothetical protein